MKRLIKISFGIVLALLVFTSCDRPEEINPMGPSICPSDDFAVTQDFKINGGTSASLNFTSQSANFTAEFSESTTWTIVITGKTSGVTKTITGEGASVNTFWRGEPGTDFFQAEEFTATISVPCYNEVGNVSGTITTVSNFSTFTNGFVVETFDGQSEGTGSYGPYGAGILTASSGVMSTITASPQGGSYYKLDGDLGDAGWYFGGSGIGINLSSLPTTDPSEIYCNFFANANGTTNANAQITIKEGSTNRTYLADIKGSEWEYHSFKLSDVGVTDPTQCGSIDWQLGASPEKTATAELNFDFFVITTGGPLFD